MKRIGDSTEFTQFKVYPKLITPIIKGRTIECPYDSVNDGPIESSWGAGLFKSITKNFKGACHFTGTFTEEHNVLTAYGPLDDRWFICLCVDTTGFLYTVNIALVPSVEINSHHPIVCDSLIVATKQDHTRHIHSRASVRRQVVEYLSEGSPVSHVVKDDVLYFLDQERSEIVTYDFRRTTLKKMVVDNPIFWSAVHSLIGDHPADMTLDEYVAKQDYMIEHARGYFFLDTEKEVVNRVVVDYAYDGGAYASSTLLANVTENLGEIRWWFKMGHFIVIVLGRGLQVIGLCGRKHEIYDIHTFIGTAGVEDTDVSFDIKTVGDDKFVIAYFTQARVFMVYQLVIMDKTLRLEPLKKMRCTNDISSILVLNEARQIVEVPIDGMPVVQK